MLQLKSWLGQSAIIFSFMECSVILIHRNIAQRCPLNMYFYLLPVVFLV